MAAELRAVGSATGDSASVAPDISFDDFWLLYPRRVAKKDARKMWGRVPAELHVEVLTALVAWRQVWSDKDPEYLPHPATWLNGERWEDELPAGYRSSPPVAKNGAVARDQPPPVRTAIPEHVRALLAKLRGKA